MRINILIVAAIAAANFAYGQNVPQVPNAPFSAEIIETRVQTLADGTHITQPEFTTKVYRDSLGRTRSESGVRPPIFISIVIDDPVEGARYVFRVNRNGEEKKIAQKLVMPKRSPALITEVAKSPEARPAQVNVGQAQAIQFSPGAMALPFGAESKTESLGTQTIEGLAVDGRRETTTWGVGTMGNDRDVVTSNEFWASKELGMTVFFRISDPRTGERTSRMTNVSRTEPDPALFQVPADYTIEEKPAPNAVPVAPNPAR